MDIKLNLGCGTLPVDGFINIDHRDGVGGIVDDAFELTTVDRNSVSEMISSHILEHACFDRVHDILMRWKEVLIKGGVLWIAVPNFELVMNDHIQRYNTGDISWEYFNSRIFGNSRVAKDMYGTNKLKDIDGIYSYEMAFHRSVFTRNMMVDCLSRAGFIYRLIDKIPYKKKHKHEICYKAIK